MVTSFSGFKFCGVWIANVKQLQKKNYAIGCFIENNSYFA
jgi:hypothetical protein